MEMETLRAFLGWCTILNGALLIIVFLIMAAAGDGIYRIHGRWFNITREAFTLTVYCFIGAMKLVVLMFNLVPYLALVILNRP